MHLSIVGPRYLMLFSLAMISACASLPQPSSSVSTAGNGPADDLSARNAHNSGVTNASGMIIPAVIGLPPSPTDSLTHYIDIGDVLRVTVFGVEDLSTHERVNPSGTLVMPLIGSIEVAGLTTEQAERAIESALGTSYLQNPQVDIFVEEYANRQITVDGQVKSAGVFLMTGPMTLMQAIALAGGVSKTADQTDVLILRKPPNGSQITAYVVDLRAIMKGELGDPPLMAEDKVMVPESGVKVFTQNLSEGLRNVVTIYADPL